MTGDGTNDAPALAQADVAVAMNTGTQAAKEAGNMVDLDSNPTKLIEIVEIGKQLLMTRGALTTFSIANDVSKYFAIIPAAFAATYPQLGCTEHHALGNAHQRDSVGGDFQRADHHLPDPAGAAWRALSPAWGVCLAAGEPADLRSGRAGRAVCRHQAHRPALGRAALNLNTFSVRLREGKLNMSVSINKQSQMSQIIRPAFVSLVVFTVITGVLYPLLITGIARLLFPRQANGSLIVDKATGQIIGSELIGEEFSNPVYFWGRLSATAPAPYNAAASSGSNFGPLNPNLIGKHGAVQIRINALHAADAMAGVENRAPIPVDLVTASASGLDPQISPAAALYQVPRIAALRSVDEATVRNLVDEFTEGRTLFLLGEPRVNVLRLNLALDKRYPIP